MRSHRLIAGAAAGAGVLCLTLFAWFQGEARAQNAQSNRILDNERVTVMRIPAPAGMKQEMHKSPQDIVAIQATPGRIEVAVGNERTAGGQGKVWYLPKTLDHAVFNTGTEAAEMIVIMLK